MSYSLDNAVEWMTFLNNHRNLQRLDFTALSNEIVDLHQLTAHLHNLTDISLLSWAPISADSIVRFIENNEQLNRFKYRINLPSEKYFKELRELLEDNWHSYEVGENFGRGLLFERKQYSPEELELFYYNIID